MDDEFDNEMEKMQFLEQMIEERDGMERLIDDLTGQIYDTQNNLECVNLEISRLTR